MATDDELIAEAIRAGKVRRMPVGARALPERPPVADETRVRPESCGSGRQCPALPGADDLRW